MKQNLEEYVILEKLGEEVKRQLATHEKECIAKVLEALKEYPNAPQPQNLLGIIAEKHYDGVLAMAHYRAAYALAPYYRPSRDNMDRYAERHRKKECYFTDQDCENEDKEKEKKKCDMMHWREL